MSDKVGLELETLAGMAYDPISGLWRMTENTGVNYIGYFQKSGLVTGGACSSGSRPRFCQKYDAKDWHALLGHCDVRLCYLKPSALFEPPAPEAQLAHGGRGKFTCAPVVAS